MRPTDLSLHFDPLLTAVMVALGFALFAILARTVNPFAKASGRAAGRRLAIARIVGATVALSWLAPRLGAAGSLPRAIGHAALAAAVLLGALALAAALLFGLARALRRPRERAPAAGEWPTGRAPSMTAAQRARALDPVDDETHDAMARLSDAVRSHDLGDAPARPNARPNAGPNDGVPVATPSGARDADVVADAGPAAPRDPDAAPDAGAREAGTELSVAPRAAPDPSEERSLTEAELADAPRGALIEQVRAVAVRNTRLHKLVVAQQASLEGEREAHAHTKRVARRAAEAARTALEHKRIATKAARRERAERLRIADAHERSRQALANAMALLRSQPDAAAGAIPGAAPDGAPAGDAGDRAPGDAGAARDGSDLARGAGTDRRTG